MMLKQCLYELVEDVYDDITNGECGTDTSLFNKDQTGVITAVAATDIALATKTLSKRSINTTHLLATTVGNGSTVTEYEVNNTTISYNRCVKAGLAKTSNDELTMIHNFDFGIVI